MIDLVSVNVHFDTSLDAPYSVLCDTILRADVQVQSRFPGSVRCDELCVTVQPVKTSAETEVKGTPAHKKSAELTLSTESRMIKEEYSNKNTSHSTLLQIKSQQHLKQDGSLSSVALVCPNVHQFLG